MGRLRVMRVIARMNVGGPAVQVSGLMRHLPHDEFDQRLYTGWCADDEADYLETQAPDVDATRIDGLGRAIRPGEDALALGSLVRAMREFRPHIVHTHTAKAGVLGRAAAKAAGVGSASVHTFHGHLLHGYFSPAKTKAVIGIERLLARSTDRLVAVGAQVRDDLLAAGIGRPDQYSIIPPGLELLGALSQQEARRALGIRPGGPTVAFIGRLTSIKRPDRFVEVVRRVAEACPDVQFIVAGEGVESGVVRSAAESLPIRMLGWRSDVENVLAASDAVLLTSDNEGTPLSLIQAALSGLPVVASDVGSVSDVVVAGQTGWLAPADDFALAAATAEMLADPAEARRRGLAAKERADRLYGVQRLGDDHARLYREIAATHSRA
jgi:glycosyltransferase involved in cell wall biosynthesis